MEDIMNLCIIKEMKEGINKWIKCEWNQSI
jgi:hypothetical protein